jgi:hypothetical protein
MSAKAEQYELNVHWLIQVVLNFTHDFEELQYLQGERLPKAA